MHILNWGRAATGEDSVPLCQTASDAAPDGWGGYIQVAAGLATDEAV
jgi:hypothetical protein